MARPSVAETKPVRTQGRGRRRMFSPNRWLADAENLPRTGSGPVYPGFMSSLPPDSVCEPFGLRSWRMLGEEALRRGDRELAQTLTEPARVPMLEIDDDRELLTRLRGLAASPFSRLR